MSNVDPFSDLQVLRGLGDLIEESLGREDLKQLVRLTFGVSLESLVYTETGLTAVIFYLLIECQKRGWQQALVAAVWLRRKNKLNVAQFISSHWPEVANDKAAEDVLQAFQQPQARRSEEMQQAERPRRRETVRTPRLAFMRAFPDGLLESVAHDILPRIGVGKTIGELIGAGDLIRSPEKPAMLHATGLVSSAPPKDDQLFRALVEYIGQEDFFGGLEDGIGRGQARLLQDLVRLAENARTGVARNKMRDLAYSFLESPAASRYRLIAIDIRETMIRWDDDTDLYADQAADWLELGDAKRAMQLLDPFVDQINIGASTAPARDIDMLLNWARACKEAGEGAARNDDVLRAYDSALRGIERLLSEHPGELSYVRAKAEALHNKATHLAVFGRRRDVAAARQLFEEAQQLFGNIGGTGGRIEVMVGSAAILIDRDPAPRGAAVLLKSFDRVLNEVGSLPSASTRFQYWYQRARILKRVDGQNPERAVQAYEEARKVAVDGGRRDRALIAERWIATLRPANDRAQQAARLGEIADGLYEFPDAWPARAAADMYCDLLDAQMITSTSPRHADLLTRLVRLAIHLNDASVARRILKVVKKHAPAELCSSLVEQYGTRLRKVLKLGDGAPLRFD